MDPGIGKLSQITGVKIPTIRYYEQIGLSPEGLQNKGNQRRYDRDAVKRLLFILPGVGSGFDIRDQGSASSSRRLGLAFARGTRIAKQQLASVEEKIAQLGRP